MFSQFGGNPFGGNNGGNFNQSNPFVFGQQQEHSQQNRGPITSAFGGVPNTGASFNTQFNGNANGSASGKSNTNQRGNRRGQIRRGNSGRGRGGAHVNNGSTNALNSDQSQSSWVSGQNSSMNSINYFQSSSTPALSQPPQLPTPSGFQPRSRRTLAIPTYLLPVHNIIRGITQKPDSWDVQNQEKMLQKESMQHSGTDLETLYRQLQAMREVERREMENRGLVDQQDTRKDLKDAIIFVGTCQDMCPTFERVRRAYEKDTKPFEKVLSVDTFMYLHY